MRKNMNLISESLRTNRIRIPFFIILFLLLIIGFCMGELAYIWSWTKVLSILAGGLIIVIALLRVEFALALLMLVMMDILGFIDRESFLRVPHMFKFRDLFLVLVLGRVFLEATYRRDLKRVLKTPLTKPVFFYIACAGIVILLSAMFGGTSLNAALREGRYYFYYATFFVALYFVKEDKQLRRIIFYLFLFVCILALLLIGQFILGSRIWLAPYWREVIQESGSFLIIRYYPQGLPLLMLMFLCSVGILAYSIRSRAKTIFFMVASLLGLGIIFQLYRTIWWSIFAAFAFIWVILPKARKSNYFWWGVCLFISALVVGGLGAYIMGSRPSIFFSFIGQRFLSPIEEIKYQTHNFGFSVAFARARIGLFIKNPIWGAGFVSEAIGRELELRGAVGSIDNAWVSILATTGLLGAICLGWMSIVFFKRAFAGLRSVTCTYYKGMLTGFIGFYVASLISLIYISPFVWGAGISTLGLMMGLTEVIIAINKETIVHTKI